MQRMRVALPLCLIAATWLAPARASALTYPVATAAQLTDALSATASTPAADRIELAGGAYDGQFTYSGSSEVQIVGAGWTRSIIRTPAGTGLDVQSGAGSRVADLGVEITGGSGARGLRAGAAGMTVEDVSLTRSGGTDHVGVLIAGADAVLRRVTVTGAYGRAILGAAAGTSISELSTYLSGGTGIEVSDSGSSATVRRARIVGGSLGVAAVSGAAVTFGDSIVDTRGVASAVALSAGDADDPAAFSSALTADRVTLIGSTADLSTAVGVRAGTGNETDEMSATVRDSIISGFDTALRCLENATAPAGTITVNDSALSGATSNDCGDGAGDPGITTSGTTDADPRFLDPAVGDFRLRWDSPLLDQAKLTPGAGVTDLLGAVRAVDGNGDGSAVADLGAYEYGRNAPQVISSVAAPASIQAGQPITFTAQASDLDPAETLLLTYAWAFDDGTAATGPSVTKAFAASGTHSASLTVTDPSGRTAKATVSVAVTPPPRAPAPPPAAPADRTAPKISGLVLAKRITRAAGAPKLVARKLAELRLTLSEAATLRLTFARARPGSKGLTPVKGGVTLKAAKGALGVRLRGALSAKTLLAPGAYQVTIVATDAAGNRSAPARATFTLRAAKR